MRANARTPRRSKNKKIRAKVDSLGLYGRWRLLLIRSCCRLYFILVSLRGKINLGERPQNKILVPFKGGFQKIRRAPPSLLYGSHPRGVMTLGATRCRKRAREVRARKKGELLAPLLHMKFFPAKLRSRYSYYNQTSL